MRPMIQDKKPCMLPHISVAKNPKFLPGYKCQGDNTKWKHIFITPKWTFKPGVFIPHTALKEPTEASWTFCSEFSLPPIWFPKATDLISNVFIKVLDLPIVLVDLLMHTPADSMEVGSLGCKEVQGPSCSSRKPNAMQSWHSKCTLDQCLKVFLHPSGFCSFGFCWFINPGNR